MEPKRIPHILVLVKGALKLYPPHIPVRRAYSAGSYLILAGLGGNSATEDGG